MPKLRAFTTLEQRLFGQLMGAFAAQALSLRGPMVSSLVGVVLFYVGLKLISPERRAGGILSETLAVALLCPSVAALVRLSALPLSA